METGVGQVTRYQKGTDWLQFNLRVDSDQAQIRVPIYDFPNWEIKVNGVETDFDSQNELGLPTFALPSGEYRVTARLTNTPIRTVGNWLSLFSWGAFLILIFKPEYLEFSNHSDHRRIKNKNWRKKIIRLAKT